ncbi:efflux RND transporter periplasmic adaptor subunit [Rubellicoccus peritrichatus]|uniref:Efflux RND transporter periplasmic adaptor subunit n=1 Tax=Rubellicoccus peritrichatus TaxID=3080537 RepID=A0AAQ3LFR3_9BACT|nr:efflux RND transporter periplasmic adaptor subunit [Puniceicoccus sp. CR14]WOO43000.1 efflux RND transporter periplasmic adaptor subunit [Puniceicoccus sp. CR14]
MKTNKLILTKRIAFANISLFGVLFLIIGSNLHAFDMTPTVRVEPVEVEVDHATQRVIGTLRAVSRADVASQESGAVIEVMIDEGQTVKANQPLARLDARRIEAQLKGAKAALVTAKSLIKQRKVEVDRAKKDMAMHDRLLKNEASSESEFLDAERDLLVAETQYESANNTLIEIQSNIDLLEVRLADSTIVAPFDGQVVASHVEPGEWLAPGTVVATLISSGKIEAWLTVPERLAGSVKRHGPDFTVRVRAVDEEFKPINTEIIPEIDMRARTFNVIVTIDNKSGVLNPGMSVTADLPAGESQEYVALPRDALIRANGDTYVFIVKNTGEALPVAEQLPVEIAFEHNGQAFVLPGAIQEGDMIVIEGNERLMPGASVNAIIDSSGAAFAQKETAETAGS